MQGTTNTELTTVRPMRKDLSLRESIVVVPLIVLLLFFGFYPKPLLDVINPAVAATLHDINKTDPAPGINQEAGK
jgi:NADH-quinone oxidoreductase subunit M